MAGQLRVELEEHSVEKPMLEKDDLVRNRKRVRFLCDCQAFSRNYNKFHLVISFCMALMGFASLGYAHTFYSNCPKPADIDSSSVDFTAGVCRSMEFQRPHHFVLFSALASVMACILRLNYKLSDAAYHTLSHTAGISPPQVHFLFSTGTYVELLWSAMVLQTHCTVEDAELTRTDISRCEVLRIFVWVSFFWALARCVTRIAQQDLKLDVPASTHSQITTDTTSSLEVDKCVYKRSAAYSVSNNVAQHQEA
mmetsp:Transcript_31048/g.54521  ORF Transcript_31048/g.54521 Transcript_31048/m.54521 type:complete len:252 (-) Transcript_31048:200-955(-)